MNEILKICPRFRCHLARYTYDSEESKNGRSLVHMFLDYDTFEEISKMPLSGLKIENCQFDYFSTVLDFILKCGANPNEFDSNRNTPLHYVVKLLLKFEWFEFEPDVDEEEIRGSLFCSELTEILVYYGAHIDAVDSFGETAADYLKRVQNVRMRDLIPSSHISLKCLAARALNHYEIEIDQKMFPKSINDFIKLHYAKHSDDYDHSFCFY